METRLFFKFNFYFASLRLCVRYLLSAVTKSGYRYWNCSGQGQLYLFVEVQMEV